MRLTTWNCHHGDVEQRLALLPDSLLTSSRCRNAVALESVGVVPEEPGVPKHQSSLDNPRTLVGTRSQVWLINAPRREDRSRSSTWRVD